MEMATEFEGNEGAGVKKNPSFSSIQKPSSFYSNSMKSCLGHCEIQHAVQ